LVILSIKFLFRDQTSFRLIPVNEEQISDVSTAAQQATFGKVLDGPPFPGQSAGVTGDGGHGHTDQSPDSVRLKGKGASV
jgi:hypothetical protein